MDQARDTTSISAFAPAAPHRAGAEAYWELAARASGFVVAGLAALVFCIVYIRHEQAAYYWDWTAYFDRFEAYGALFTTGGTGWLTALTESVRRDDYNLAILTPMLPAYAVFGGSRVVYVATIVILYLVPAAALAARLARRVVDPAAARTPLWLLTSACLFWPFWFAAIRGMPDVAGLIPLGLTTLILIETRYLTRASLAQGMLVGSLIWTSFLLRRWYAYADVSLEATSIVFAAWTAWRGRADRPDALRQAARTAAAAFLANCLVVAALLLTFQAPLVARILQTSYGDIYAAYQKPLSETAQLVAAQAGIALILAMSVGLARAVVTRNVAILFLAALAVTTSILFLRTQAPGAQHVLPIFFWMFPVAIFGATTIPSRPTGAAARTGIVALMLAGFLSVLVPPAERLLAHGRPLLPSETFYPLKVVNAEAYRRLATDLEKFGAKDGIAVFASSRDLCGSLLSSLAPALRQAIVPISDVDARDGLRLAPFEARIAVATATPVLHLPPAFQKVVSIPNGMIIDGSGPGNGYRRVGGPYALDGGVVAWIYERDRPFSEADKVALQRALTTFYPHWARRADGYIR